MMNQLYLQMKENERKAQVRIQEQNEAIDSRLEQQSRVIPHTVITEVRNEIGNSVATLKNEVLMGVVKAVVSPMVTESIAQQVSGEVQQQVSKQLHHGIEKIEESIGLCLDQQMKYLSNFQQNLQASVASQLQTQQVKLLEKLGQVGRENQTNLTMVEKRID